MKREQSRKKSIFDQFHCHLITVQSVFAYIEFVTMIANKSIANDNFELLSMHIVLITPFGRRRKISTQQKIQMWVKHCRPFHWVRRDKALWLKFETISNYTSKNLRIDYYVIRNPCRKLFAHAYQPVNFTNFYIVTVSSGRFPLFLAFNRVECLFCLYLYSSLFQRVFTASEQVTYSTCFLQWTN